MKKGFTLIEIILVIAIILILAAAVALSTNAILANARAANTSISANISEKQTGIQASESKLASYGF
jgi:prepilin-type N-terminal cleavage/methylation domain-containing protein